MIPLFAKRIRGQSFRNTGAILAVQLVFTFVVAYCCSVSPMISEFFGLEAGLRGPLRNFAFAIFVMTYLSILYSDCQYPCDMLSLAGMTVALTYVMTYFCVVQGVSDVLPAAMALTAGIVTMIFFIAMHMSFDVTRQHSKLMVIGLIGILCFFFKSYLMGSVSKEFGAYAYVFLVVSILLFTLFDIQTITGERYLEMDPKDVYYGAARLYFDIMWIFMLLAVPLCKGDIIIPK